METIEHDWGARSLQIHFVTSLEYGCCLAASKVQTYLIIRFSQNPFLSHFICENFEIKILNFECEQNLVSMKLFGWSLTMASLHHLTSLRPLHQFCLVETSAAEVGWLFCSHSLEVSGLKKKCPWHGSPSPKFWGVWQSPSFQFKPLVK